MPVTDYRSGGSMDRCKVIKVKGEGGVKSVKIPPIHERNDFRRVDEREVYAVAL